MLKFSDSLPLLFTCLLGTALITGACNDPSFVGSDLLEDDIIDFETRKDFEIESRIYPSDSILVFDLTDRISTHRIGQVNDDYFGTTRAAMALQLVNEIRSPDTSQVITIDSVVLAMAYNLDGFYGDTLVPMNVEVYRLTEFYNARSEAFFSNQEYAISSTPVGSVELAPKPKTPIVRFTDNEDNGTDTIMLIPQLRVPLDHQIGQEILGLDSAALATDSAFIANFNGLFITTTDRNGSLMGVHTTSDRAVLNVYYTADGEQQIRRYFASPNWLVGQTYEHRYEGSEVEPLIREWQPEEMVVQGLAGLGTRINLLGIEELQGKLINHARLRVFLNPREDLPEQGIYPNIPILRLFEVDEENQRLSDILDLLYEQVAPDLTGNFDGRLRNRVIEGDTLAVYDMNITSHLQEVLKEGRNPTLFLQANNTQNLMGTARLHGQAHPNYPIELRVVFTN